MEEVDNIIIHSLRQIGCDIEENITNLGGFNTELIVEATVRCLDTIRPGHGLSSVLPVNMAARFRLGASLAQACSELGYRGDIGYQTFLYSSEADLRRVLMFLIEKLPKESENTVDEPTSKIALLAKSLASTVSQDFQTPWTSDLSQERESRFAGRTKAPYRTVSIDVPSLEKGEEYRDYYTRYQKSVPEQMPNLLSLLPSVLSHNAKTNHPMPTNIIERLDWLNSQPHERSSIATLGSIHTLSRFASNEKAETPQAQIPQIDEPKASIVPLLEEPSTDKSDPRGQDSIKRITVECESLRNEIEAIQAEAKKLSGKLAQLTVIEHSEEKDFAALEKRRKIKAKTFDLLENGEENIQKLKETIEANSNKLIGLVNQWEKHRLPLIQKYREEREKHSSKASESQRKLDEISNLKEKEKELTEEGRQKDQQYSQLVGDIQKLPKEVTRSAYTQRILEIINNVRKQKDEIDKVLGDTRSIQKEINTLTGRLERSFTVVDELIFRDARTNDASRKAYKLLATLHSDCSDLVNLVEETGATVREIRDLEEQIDSESTKNVGDNLERITADLKQMKQETATLTAQLQNKNS
ncbi:coiled-coil domain-containing protein 22 homolog [Belonocnema kinseyi]|uniref:coiled-coil domain-containing protein 22 homolog n=1 Tax=Belonocnema kinseyi TaxID=2817044 RepID=UPI00143DB882|nr:coiled-coil domain-containing protein 22 homolog [Belonocnema kinseyi]